MKYLFVLIFLLILFSCTKDKTPTFIDNRTIWEKVTGKYNVYDTLGVFLYEMEIIHKDPIVTGSFADSLQFINFDNDFVFTRSQSTNLPENLISFVSPFHAKDKNNKSWSLFNSSNGGIYDNKWRNDTIRMCFRKHNTPWWPSESVPYLDTIIKQIAVKQH